MYGIHRIWVLKVEKMASNIAGVSFFDEYVKQRRLQDDLNRLKEYGTADIGCKSQPEQVCIFHLH